MVKIKSIMLMTACFLILFFFLNNEKAERNGGWKLDPEYSANLTIMSTNYKAITGLDMFDSVDMIRIFKNLSCDGKILDLPRITSKELIFESKDKDFIKVFLTSVQVEENHIEKCFQNKLCENFYVVAFDETHKRAGYFVLYQCKINEQPIGIIKPFQQGDSSAIYYNKSLIKLMQEKHIIVQ